MLDGLRYLVKRWVRGDSQTRFEPSGNFIYRIETQELAKLMTATGESFLAYRKFNDFYMPRLSADVAQGASWGRLLTRLGIFTQDLLCRAGLLAWGLAGVVLFKGHPGQNILEALRRDGYTVQALPQNPYSMAN